MNRFADKKKLVLATLCLLATALTSFAQDLCDPGLLGSEESPMAYQLRGNRCEGIYKLEVNSDLLRLVSLVEVFEAFDPESPNDLEIDWKGPGGIAGRLRILATSTAPRSYYRMDTVVEVSAGTFRWPTEILARTGLAREDLGVLGSIAHPRPPDPDFERIYLPLRIRQRLPVVATGIHAVALLPQVKLNEVYVSVVPIDLEVKSTGPPLLEKKPLEYGYYPAKAPVHFELPKLSHEGYYRVDLLAIDSTDRPMTYRFVLHHRGNE